MTTRTRATRPLLTCAMVALACATRFPCARAAEVSERERGGAEVSTRAGYRFARPRRFFGGQDLPLQPQPSQSRLMTPRSINPPPPRNWASPSRSSPRAASSRNFPRTTATHERRERRQLGQLESGWIDARATWYGGPNGAGPDGMSIYTGSCGYGKALGNHFISAWYVP